MLYKKNTNGKIEPKDMINSIAMLTLFENKEVRQSKSHLRNLVALAKADEKLAKSEVACIYKIGQRKGLSKNQIKSILKNTEYTESVIPGEISESFAHVCDLVSLMMADGVVDDREFKFCANYASKLGLRDVTAELLIRKIYEGLTAGKSVREIEREAAVFMV